jgi:LDH2 family malate/lactate/ureidoglycolate dehydrogenase
MMASTAHQTIIPVCELRRLALDLCLGAGIPSAHADLQTDLLLEADMRGRASHGLMRLPRILERVRNGVTDPMTVGVHRWQGARLDVDGERGLGPVVAMAALEKLQDKVTTEGVAAAAIRNNNHIGMLAWYAEHVAHRGAILLAMTTSEALVHPWGGRTAMLGTNPIAIGIPTAHEPFVLDMATSLVAMGVVHDRASRGLALPLGWALDSDGNPTTDAQAAKRGALAPFGEAKGYALALALELLVTALAGSAIGRDVKGTLDSVSPCNKGDVFVVISPAAQRGLAGRLSGFLEDIRQSGGDRAVLVPGDRAAAARRAAIKGGVAIATTLWNQLKVMSKGV